MAKKLEVIESSSKVEEALLRFKTPVKTDTYTPVDYTLLYNTIVYEIKYRGYLIKNYKLTDIKGKKGFIMLEYILSTDLFETHATPVQRKFVYITSHNKIKPIIFVTGVNVYVCSNGMIVGEIKEVHKHTGNIWASIEEMLDESLNQLDNVYTQSLLDIEKFKNVIVTTNDIVYGLLGLCYGNNVFETKKQMDVVLAQWNDIKSNFNSTNPFKEFTLWSFYNWVTQALKSSTGTTSINAHKKLHEICINYVDLINKRKSRAES